MNNFWKLAAVSSAAGMMIAMPVFAAEESNNRAMEARLKTQASVSTTMREKKEARRTVDLVCMQTAVSKRETAIGAAFDKFTAAKKTAFDKRKTGLLDAWKIDVAKDRRAAIKKVWLTFREESNAARKEFHTERKAAWATFKTEAKTCRVNPSAEEPTAERDDATI